MKKILLCSICMIFTLLVFTGCKNKKEEKIEDVKPTGNITYFSYIHGSGWAGFSYEIKSNDDSYLLIYEGYGDNYGELEMEVSDDVLEEIADIINKNKIYEWDGFDKDAKDILDGDGFNINVTYSSGETIKASGYMIFPENFREASEALEDYLYSLIKNRV